MPIHYINRDPSYLLTTNYKVWFSTLEKQNNLRQIMGQELIDLNSKPSSDHRPPHYLLVRDPYARAESFFKDKFRKTPAKVTGESPHTWQHCQQIFFPHFDISLQQTTTEIRDRLLAISFTSFISLLPKVMQLDQHLTPQTWAAKVWMQGKIHSLAFDRLLKVESPADRSFINDALQLDTRVVRNSTQQVAADIVWGIEELAVIHALYQDDFHQLGYDQR